MRFLFPIILLLASPAGAIVVNAGIPPASDTVISSGSVTSAGQTIALSADGFSAGAVQITGTWVGQFEFEATVNGTTWISRNVYNGVGLTNATAGTGIFTFPIGPFNSFRVRSSVFTSGSATVFFRASNGGYYPQ